MLAVVDLPLHSDDPLLILSLVKEVRDQGEELAFRLELPGYTDLCIGGVAARLRQTLKALQQHLPSPTGRS